MFNQVNWSAINTTAQFNPQGQMVNANFGQATAARVPARHAGSLAVHVLGNAVSYQLSALSAQEISRLLMR